MRTHLFCSLVAAALIVLPTAALPAAVLEGRDVPDTAEELFKYVDAGCKERDANGEWVVRPIVNRAVKDMNTLVASAERSLTATINKDPETRPGDYYLDSYFGKLRPGDTPSETAQWLLENKFKKLGTHLEPQTVSLYCDGSAWAYTRAKMEGEERGDPLGGHWYAAPDRRATDTPPIYILGSERENICDMPHGNTGRVAGISAPGVPVIIMCPAAFTDDIIAPLKELPDTIPEYPTNTPIDTLQCPGSTMMHEMTHAILSTSAKEKYNAFPSIMLAAQTPLLALKNADNYVFYSLSAHYERTFWRFGRARPLESFGGGPSKRKVRRDLYALEARQADGESDGTNSGDDGKGNGSHGSDSGYGGSGNGQKGSGSDGERGGNSNSDSGDDDPEKDSPAREAIHFIEKAKKVTKEEEAEVEAMLEEIWRLRKANEHRH